MLQPTDSPPASWHPLLTASMIPGPPPVMTAYPRRARAWTRGPVCRGDVCWSRLRQSRDVCRLEVGELLVGQRRGDRGLCRQAGGRVVRHLEDLVEVGAKRCDLRLKLVDSPAVAHVLGLLVQAVHPEVEGAGAQNEDQSGDGDSPEGNALD